MGKNITLKKGKGKQYYLFYDIGAHGRRTNGKEDGHFEEENQDLKKWRWGRILSFKGTLYTPVGRARHEGDLIPGKDFYFIHYLYV